MMGTIPGKVPLEAGEMVLLESKGYMYSEKPSIWAGAQGKAPMQIMTWLTNRRIISEPHIPGTLAKAGLFLAFGVAGAGAASSHMFQSEDAIIFPLGAIQSAEPFAFHRQRMIKLGLSAGSKTGEFYFGLDRIEDVPGWCTQIQNARNLAVPAPSPSCPSLPSQLSQDPVLHPVHPGPAPPPTSTKVFCGHCGSPIPATVKFCTQCGARQ